MICEPLVLAIVGKRTLPRLLAFSQPLLFLVVYASRGYQHRPPLTCHLPFSSRSDHEELWLENYAGTNVGCRFCIRHSSPALPEKNLLLSCSNVCHWLFIFLMFVCSCADIAYFGQGKETKGPSRSAIIHWCQFESRTACCTNTGNCDHFVFCHLVSVDSCFFFSLQENLWLKVMVQHTCELDLWLSLTLLWTLLFTAQEFETSAMPISRYPARCSVAELKMQTPVLL